jgi:predicted RNase H-like HicB family nuclease
MSSLQHAKDTKTRTFTAILHWEEDVYVAECPEVGTASQGETIEEAIVNLQEATELYLEEFPLFETAPHCLLFNASRYIKNASRRINNASLYINNASRCINNVS